MAHILALHASHNRNGCSRSLAAAVLERIPGDKQDVFLPELDITPCAACGYCRDHDRCVLDAKDAMADIRGSLHSADAVLLVSPIHFSSLAAPPITVISRLQPEWLRRAGGGRKPARSGQGALVVTAGSLYANMFEPARIVAAAAFRTLGLHNAGMVAAPQTDATAVGDNAAALARAARLGQVLAEALARAGQEESAPET